MKLSIITVCYNSSETIRDTLCSLASQDYNDIEYIVIDGASSDGTIDIVRSFGSRVTKFISESDNGIYDAMNKGIRLATGDIVGFINADDFYESPKILSKVMKLFDDTAVDACYGDLCYVKKDNTSSVVRYWRSSDFVLGSFSKAWCPPHPTFFVRRSIYEDLGYFDLSYKIAADVELMMRFLEKARIRSKYLPEILVKMRVGGTTNKNLTNIFAQNFEIIRALKKHSLVFSFVNFWLNKIASRAIQFFQRPQ